MQCLNDEEISIRGDYSSLKDVTLIYGRFIACDPELAIDCASTEESTQYWSDNKHNIYFMFAGTYVDVKN